jgi:ABC-type nickel/cobalt efflux system permease component RcnA
MRYFSRFAIALIVLLCAQLPPITQASAQTTPPATATDAGKTSPFALPKAQGEQARPPRALPSRDAVAPPQGGANGFFAWLFAMQVAFHRSLIEAMRFFKTADAWTTTGWLALISFGYGVFHAAGPGHGKAVVTSYVLADGQTLRRGIAISFLAAGVQALSALAVVLVLKVVLNAAGKANQDLAERWLETLSWGLVAALGAWLVWRQLASFRGAAVAAPRTGAHDRGHVHGPGCGHDHHHHGHKHAHTPDHKHDHVDGDTCTTCGHVHMPTSQTLAGDWSWRRALGLATAVGIRPCTGAILVLIFAISQGIVWAGVISTFAMAIGTAMTVSLLAALAVGSRTLMTRYASQRGSAFLGRLESGIGLAAALVVFGLGASFFWASLNGTMPL